MKDLRGEIQMKRRVGLAVYEAYRRVVCRNVWGETSDLNEVDCEKLAEAAIAEMEKINAQVSV